MSAPNMMIVTVPQGSVGGQTIVVATPDGQILTAIVPPGLVAGNSHQLKKLLY
jgi:hypothetical protein